MSAGTHPVLDTPPKWSQHETHLLIIAITTLGAFALGTGGLAVAADPVPSGQRVLGRSVVEPVYDADHSGRIGFISTPGSAPVANDQHAAAPLYLPVYPEGAGVGPLICPHVPVDACPDHGDAIAGVAQSVEPAVYGAGVLGHDHLMSFPGPDSRIVREPVVVLFTNTRAASEHLLTGDAIEAAVDRGDAVTVPLPQASLRAELVSVQVWNLAAPVQ